MASGTDEPAERPDFRSVLCLYTGRIGDVIVATPFLRALRGRFPRARVRLVVGRRAAEVLPLIPFIDGAAVLDKPLRLDGHLKLAWSLLRESHDLLVDLNSSFSKTSTLLARAARARARLAFDKGRGPAVFDRTIPPPAVREHMAERYARLAAAIGAPYSPELELRVPPADDAEAERLLKSACPSIHSIAADRNRMNRRTGTFHSFRILVHPGNLSRRPSLWPAERLTELCARLQKDSPDRELYFLAGPGEREYVRSIAAALPRPAPILPTARLGAAAGMVRRMDLLIGSLTSTTHLAAALGVPTFAFYEGYTEAVWHPRGARHGGVVGADWDHVQSITVDQAWAALSEHLARLTRS